MIVGFILSFLCVFVSYVLNGDYFIWGLICGLIIAILSYFSVLVKVYPIGYRTVIIMGSYHSMKGVIL